MSSVGRTELSLSASGPGTSQSQAGQQQNTGLNPSTPSSVARLRLPEPLPGVEDLGHPPDETPTPIRIIREMDEVGIFPDLPQLNPFDEKFRDENVKAATSKADKKVKSTLSPPVANVSDGDSLNTPQIFNSQDLAEVSSVMISGNKAKRGNNSNNSSSFRAIAPSPSNPKKAQLLLQLPDGGGSVHLSSLPFVKEDSDTGLNSPGIDDFQAFDGYEDPSLRSKRANTSNNSSSSMPASQDITEKRAELLERNRMAAARSRQKKKRESEELRSQYKFLQKSHGVLKLENDFLRREITRLKELLRPHANCPVTKELGMEDTLRQELQAKVICLAPTATTSAALTSHKVSAKVQQQQPQQQGHPQEVVYEVGHFSVKEKIKNNMKQKSGQQ